MSTVLASVLLAATLAAPSEAPPGGYWTMSEQREREREPLDGEDELTIGSVLFSLGLLRAGAGLLSVWMAARPSLCPAPDPVANPDAEQGCGSLRTYGWVGVGEGGLLTGTGIVYLAIGASRRRQHQRWERGEPLARARRQQLVGQLGQRLRLSPWLGRTGGGAVLQLRF